MTRVYLPIKIQENSKIFLPKEISHHLLRVMRLKIGEQITLFDGSTIGEYNAKLLSSNKGLAEIAVENFMSKNSESPLNIHLGQVISRGDKMDLTIQKATELGVTKITPLLSERCNVKLNKERMTKKISHWQKVAISAAEQSGRIKVPTVEPVIDLANFISNIDSELKLILALNKKNSENIFENNPQSIALLVGPEGGFSQNEEGLAFENGFKALTLGPRTLRTETAGLVAIAILQEKFGDLFGSYI